MDAALQLITDTGVALRREMLERGATDRDIYSGLRRGLLRRVRHGAYTTVERWDSADEYARARLRCIATSKAMGDRVVLTHTSSLVMQGVPVWGADLTKVHVTRLDGATGRINAGVVHHEGLITEDDLLSTADRVVVSRASRAVVEHASIASIESGLVSADAALHANLFAHEELADEFRRMEHWPGTQRVHIVVRMADGLAESPGESRCRFLCWRHGLPAPALQFEVYDEVGRLIGRSDFAWPEHRLLGEFDGRSKYGRFLRPGQQAADAVFAEKRREDRLREVTGWSMVRLVWSDLDVGAHTAERIRRMMLRAA
jgi:hypothetical protein